MARPLSVGGAEEKDADEERVGDGVAPSVGASRLPLEGTEVEGEEEEANIEERAGRESLLSDRRPRPKEGKSDESDR